MGSNKNKDLESPQIFRFTFEAVVPVKGSKTKTYPVGDMTIGQRKDGRERADQLQVWLNEEMAASLDGETVLVRPIRHEVVAFEIVDRLQNLVHKVGLSQEVCTVLAGKLKLATGDPRTIEQIVFEELSGALKARSLEQQQDEPVAVIEPDASEPQPKRRLGIEAFEEIMASPAESD